ncbi:hypothetical protein HXX76_011388 [Chlamydomonas incerta]|uniref:Uncharacterized protein n=1 Tax=Chlamydomonas incerta TaxID=51695 RepID=A0A835VWQ5_CHLIN|nr:hypothetical protein HXX76_011388 [Chlamydomonas incerta]|eukprot:KAG2428683.1 hypothetical protein HXX76_011388 [Chlamydomonas incerta]
MKFLSRCFCLAPTRSGGRPAEDAGDGDAAYFEKALHLKAAEESALRWNAEPTVDTPMRDSAASISWAPGHLDNLLQEQGSWCRQRGDMTGVDCVRYVTRSPAVSSGGAAPLATRLSGGSAGLFGQRRGSKDDHAHEALLEARRRSSAGGGPVSTRSHRNSSGGSVEYDLHSCYFNPLVEGSAEAEADAECDRAETQEPTELPQQQPEEVEEEGQAGVSSQQLGVLHAHSAAIGDSDISEPQLAAQQSTSQSCEVAGGAAEERQARAPASGHQAEPAAMDAATASSAHNADAQLEGAESHRETCPAAAAAAGSFAASFSSAAGRRHQRTQSSYLDLATAAERLSEALSEHASYIFLMPPPVLRPAPQQKAHRVSSPAILASHECLGSPQRQQPQQPLQACSSHRACFAEGGGSCDTASAAEPTGIAVATSVAHAPAEATHAPSQEPRVEPVAASQQAEQAQLLERGPCPQSPCACGSARACCSVPGLCMTRALIKQMHLASRAALLPATAEALAGAAGAAQADTVAGTVAQQVSTGSPFAAAFASAETALAGRPCPGSRGNGSSSASSSEGGAVVTCVVVIPRPGAKCTLGAGAAEQASQVLTAEVDGVEENQERPSASSASSESGETSWQARDAALYSVHSSWREPMTWTPLRERCAATRARAQGGAGVTAEGSEVAQAAWEVEGPAGDATSPGGVAEPSAAVAAITSEAWLPLRQRFVWMTRSGRQRGGLTASA